MSAAQRPAYDENEHVPLSQRPTQRPPAVDRRESGFCVNRESPGDGLIMELLERFDRGDFLGALRSADRLLRNKRIPIVLLPHEHLCELDLDHRAGFVLSLIDGTSSLESILDVSGMPLLESLRVLCDLVEKRAIALRTLPPGE